MHTNTNSKNRPKHKPKLRFQNVQKLVKNSKRLEFKNSTVASLEFGSNSDFNTRNIPEGNIICVKVKSQDIKYSKTRNKKYISQKNLSSPPIGGLENSQRGPKPEIAVDKNLSPESAILRRFPKHHKQIFDAFDLWVSSGLVKPVKHHTKVAAYETIAEMLKTVSPEQLQQIIRTYAEILNHPRSLLPKTATFRVPLPEFKVWNSKRKSFAQKNPCIGKGNASLFVMLKRRTHKQAIKHFTKPIENKYPKITRIITRVWKQQFPEQLPDRYTSCRVAERFHEFWKKYRHRIWVPQIATETDKQAGSAREIFTDFLETKRGTGFKQYFMNTDKFFNFDLPNFLTDSGYLMSEERARTRRIRNRERRERGVVYL